MELSPVAYIAACSECGGGGGGGGGGGRCGGVPEARHDTGHHLRQRLWADASQITAPHSPWWTHLAPSGTATSCQVSQLTEEGMIHSQGR